MEELKKIDNSDISIGNDDNRSFEAWATVSAIDKAGELVPVDKVERNMPIYMERGGVLMDSHSGRHVGKVDSWERKYNEDAKADGIYIKAHVFKNLKIDDAIWGFIKSGVYKGISIGGQDWGKTMKCNKDRCFNEIDDLEMWEFSIVESPCQKNSWITNFNNIAKSEEVINHNDMGANILAKLENNLINKMDNALSNSQTNGINSIFNDVSKIKEHELLDMKLEMTKLFIEKLRRNNAGRT
jgi:hypothetical protein